MDRAEAVIIHVGIDLGALNIRVPEHFLQGSQIDPAAEQMGCKTMPQRMDR